MDEEKEKAIFGEDHSINYPIKPSTKLLIIQLGLLQLLMFLSVVFVFITVAYVSRNSINPASMIVLLIVLLGLAFLSDLIVSLAILLKQSHTLYVIRPKEIIVYTGVIETTNAKIYSIEKVGNIGVEQNIIGKILNFGNVVLLGESKEAFLFKLENIPDPHLYAEVLRHAAKNKKVFEILPKKGKPSEYKTALSA